MVNSPRRRLVFGYNKFYKSIFILLCTSLGIYLGVGCATSPLGRKQLILVSDNEMNEMGIKSFDQLKTTEKISSDPETIQYIKCIVSPLTQTAESQTPVKEWEVKVFKSDQVNAFALPGGKIGVYSGLLQVAKTDAQLATVLGHEIGHVIARHGAERVSEQAGTQLGLAALGTISPDNPNQKLVMGLIGIGTQIGILLPFSRTQENEADLIGLQLMAKSGFDPKQSIDLWYQMNAASGGKAPPQFLSTHPSDANRIKNLQEHMPEAISLYEEAQKNGLHPSCKRHS